MTARPRVGRGVQELPDNAIAREKSVIGTCSIMAGDGRWGRLNLASLVEVEDEQRTLLFAIPFSETVDVRSLALSLRTRGTVTSAGT